MTGWIIAGAVVLVLLVLLFAATGRRSRADRRSGGTDLDNISHQATNMRNDSSGTGFIL